MIRHFRYIWYLFRHRWFVAFECFRRGLFIRGITHDLSKLRPSEFFPYADFFYGKGRHRGKGNYEVHDVTDPWLQSRFDKALLLHFHRNPHHWQYWVLKRSRGGYKCLDMPVKDVIEMVCDWKAAGRVQHGKSSDVKSWYADNKSTMMLTDVTRTRIEFVLEKDSLR